MVDNGGGNGGNGGNDPNGGNDRGEMAETPVMQPMPFTPEEEQSEDSASRNRRPGPSSRRRLAPLAENLFASPTTEESAGVGANESQRPMDPPHNVVRA